VAPSGLPPLRAAVVGAGAFGRHHARIYSEMAEVGVHLVGIVDPAADGPGDLARRLGVAHVRDFAELPELPDLVSVAVPTTAHRTVAEPLLRRGIHCLVEKPIAAVSADAEALVRAAAEGGACLQVGHVERYNPVLAAAERLADAPLYIEAHRLAPHRPRARDVGVVMDLMIHDLEILNHLVGEVPDTVEAVARTIHGGAEDIASARIRWPSGCVAHVTASRVATQRMRTTRIFTRSGYLCLDYDGHEARLLEPHARGEAWQRDVGALAARGPSLDEARTSGRRPAFETGLAAEPLPLGEAEPLRAQLDALVDCVRRGRQPLVGGLEGLRALALAERILQDGSRRPAATGA